MKEQTFFNPKTAAYFNPSKDHRVVVITGGNSGLGWYTILHLYLHGYVVYILGRNERKIESAIAEIRAEASKRTDQYSEDEKKQRFVGRLNYIHADLTDLKSVETAAKELLSQEKQVHILINNAGLMGVPHEITKDGYEIQYQVNYAAHFLLTLELLPALKNVYETTGITPRVVSLSSLGHNAAYKYFHPSSTLKMFPSFAFTWVRYGNAKAAQIEFTKQLAKEYPKILSISVHPGVVTGTELYNHWKTIPVIGFFASQTFKAAGAVGGVSNEEGSLASLRAALDSSLTAEKDNGKYLTTGGIESTASKVASDPENAKTTWDWNLENFKKLGFNV
jgi:NAD(P)-dependent dehydrogenase (short-subunit alcohol dehydrogenase family)